MGSKAFALMAACSAFTACSANFPMEPGFDLVLEPSAGPLTPGTAEWQETLQIHWLGTGSYLIQLGDGAILTDPFVSHHGLLTSLLWGTLTPDAQKIQDTFGPLPVADAMFLAHSHWDHMLDVAHLLSLPGWSNVPVYGSPTASNILAGYGSGVASNTSSVQVDGNWHPVPAGPNTTLEYMAMEATHAPQALGFVAYDGTVSTPRTTPPTRAGHFRLGIPYAFLFRLSAGTRSYTVFVMTAASDWDRGSPPLSEVPVDVAILCVPSWASADGYPTEFLRHLKARHVVLAHFDNFFQTDGGDPTTVPRGDVDGFLRATQAAIDYPGLERIVAPNVGSVLRIAK